MVASPLLDQQRSVGDFSVGEQDVSSVADRTAYSVIESASAVLV